QNDVTLKMPAFEWVHVQLHQQKGMISLSPPTICNSALEQVGLGHRVTHLPSQLSGGEQQRVCIARALVNEPPVIFADEPTGNLDEENEQRVLDLLTDLHRQGRTIVMVTHNPALGQFADRILRLQHGKYLGEEANQHALA
ncbi:ABC transporter ATP-binding protein, partial [Escherichia coli]|uniref:ABC transporter ATP-binding protein n=1 Tax=Escherichia coli TaxID=562 RepID=UPI001D13F000